METRGLGEGGLGDWNELKLTLLNYSPSTIHWLQSTIRNPQSAIY
jgi:hypothetical protein